MRRFISGAELRLALKRLRTKRLRTKRLRINIKGRVQDDMRVAPLLCPSILLRSHRKLRAAKKKDGIKSFFKGRWTRGKLPRLASVETTVRIRSGPPLNNTPRK